MIIFDHDTAPDRTTRTDSTGPDDRDVDRLATTDDRGSGDGSADATPTPAP